MASREPRYWRDLTPRQKAARRAIGITPQAYNAYHALTTRGKADVNRRARRQGYKGYTEQHRLAQVARRGTERQKQQAALDLLNQGRRVMIPKVFRIPEGDHEAWQNLLSP